MSKKILIAGSTGMIGKAILSLAINDPKVDEIICLVRRPTQQQHAKVKEIVIADFLHYSEHRETFKNVAKLYYCVGVYTGTVNRETFRKITIDYPLALAEAVRSASPEMAMVLLSGQGADRTEKSRLSFALDKGKVENRLTQLLNTRFYSCRPGYIYPSKRRKEPTITYVISRYLYPLIRIMGPKYSITSAALATAMYRIGQTLPQQNYFENNALRQWSS